MQSLKGDAYSTRTSHHHYTDQNAEAKENHCHHLEVYSENNDVSHDEAHQLQPDDYHELMSVDRDRHLPSKPSRALADIQVHIPSCHSPELITNHSNSFVDVPVMDLPRRIASVPVTNNGWFCEIFV